MQGRKRILLLAAAGCALAGTALPVGAAPPPAPWAMRDIGVFQEPGTVGVDARGVWTLHGFQGQAPLSLDGSFFVYQPLAGDGSIVALLLGQEGGNPDWGRAGLAILEKEAARARAAVVHMTTGRGLAFSYRTEDVNPLVTEAGPQRYGPRRFPTWLRLQREGNRFTPFTSSDGFGWTQLRSSVTLRAFPENALAGMAVASASGGPVSGLFSNPVVTPGLISPNVQVCAGTGTVLLSWPPVSRAIGYMVRRSAPSTPGFAAETLTTTPIKETSFVDSNRPVDQTARYLVSAVFDQGSQPVEGWATAVTATPVPISGGMFGCDLNLDTQLAGRIAYDPTTSTYKISGSGSDIGGTEDHCFTISRVVKGDFQITARILDKPTRTSAGAKAGLMVRETLDGPSRMLFLEATAATGLALQYRKDTAADASTGRPILTDGELKPPLFLRLVRRGATIEASLSQDGVTFTPAGTPQTFAPPLPDSVFLGYAITSQNAGAVATNTFSDLEIMPAP